MQMPLPAIQPESVDHAAMGHDMPAPEESGQPVPMYHSTLSVPESGNAPSMHGMDHAAMPGMTMGPTEPRTPIPTLTEADRAAAVPPAVRHAVHDN